MAHFKCQLSLMALLKAPPIWRPITICQIANATCRRDHSLVLVVVGVHFHLQVWSSASDTRYTHLQQVQLLWHTLPNYQKTKCIFTVWLFVSCPCGIILLLCVRDNVKVCAPKAVLITQPANRLYFFVIQQFVSVSSTNSSPSSPLKKRQNLKSSKNVSANFA